METYVKSIVPNEKVEFVHFSGDRSTEAATAWAASAKLPWPTVLPDQVAATELQKYSTNFIPDYVLVDKDGKLIARGKDEIFAKVKELTK